jgi:hypothetical protein
LTAQLYPAQEFIYKNSGKVSMELYVEIKMKDSL